MSATMNVRQAAALLGSLLRPDGKPVTTRTVRNYVKRGLPRVRVGKFLAFREQAVRQWVEGRR